MTSTKSLSLAPECPVRSTVYRSKAYTTRKSTGTTRDLRDVARAPVVLSRRMTCRCEPGAEHPKWLGVDQEMDVLGVSGPPPHSGATPPARTATQSAGRGPSGRPAAVHTQLSALIQDHRASQQHPRRGRHLPANCRTQVHPTGRNASARHHLEPNRRLTVISGLGFLELTWRCGP